MAPTGEYRRGDLVWYRDRFGDQLSAKVISIDISIEPPSYGVELADGVVRETEAPRLSSRTLSELNLGASGAVSGPPDASAQSSPAARDADEDWGDYEGDAVSAAIDVIPRDAQEASYPVAASAAMLKSSGNDSSSSRASVEMPYIVASSQPLAADLFSDYGSEDTPLPEANLSQQSAAEPNAWGTSASETSSRSAANGVATVSGSSVPSQGLAHPDSFIAAPPLSAASAMVESPLPEDDSFGEFTEAVPEVGNCPSGHSLQSEALKVSDSKIGDHKRGVSRDDPLPADLFSTGAVQSDGESENGLTLENGTAGIIRAIQTALPSVPLSPSELSLRSTRQSRSFSSYAESPPGGPSKSLREIFGSKPSPTPDPAPSGIAHEGRYPAADLPSVRFMGELTSDSSDDGFGDFAAASSPPQPAATHQPQPLSTMPPPPPSKPRVELPLPPLGELFSPATSNGSFLPDPMEGPPTNANAHAPTTLLPLSGSLFSTPWDSSESASAQIHDLKSSTAQHESAAVHSGSILDNTAQPLFISASGTPHIGDSKQAGGAEPRGSDPGNNFASHQSSTNGSAVDITGAYVVPAAIYFDRSAPISLGLFGEEDEFPDEVSNAFEGASVKGPIQGLGQDPVTVLGEVAEEEDDYGDWAVTDEQPAAVGGVPGALVPYLRVWTQLLQASARELEGGHAAWGRLQGLPETDRSDQRAIVCLAGVGEVALVVAAVRATAAAHRVDMADADFFEAARACDRFWTTDQGFQEAVAVAHGRWQAEGKREQSAEESRPISDDFIFVSSTEAIDGTTGADGGEQDSRAEVSSIPLPHLLEQSRAAASGLFPFDGDVRPMAPAFSSSISAASSAGGSSEVCRLTRLPLAAMAGVDRVQRDGHVYLASLANLWKNRVESSFPVALV